jgi:drug/metabolite transporter (DMT)-like permease
VLTAVSFAGQSILGARQPIVLPPLARTGAGMLAAALIWLPVVPVWQLPFSVLDDTTELAGRIDISIPVGAAVLFAIVLGSVIPYALVINGITRIGAGAGSMAGMAEPIVAPLLAWFVLGQLLSPLQVVGIATTIACVAVVERQRFRHVRANEILVAEL